MRGTVGRTTPKAEFAGRLERMRTAMEAEDFDTLLCYGDTSNSANYRYFTDFRAFDGTNGIHHALLTLPKGGEPTLFVADACLVYAAETTPFEVKAVLAATADNAR